MQVNQAHPHLTRPREVLHQPCCQWLLGGWGILDRGDLLICFPSFWILCVTRWWTGRDNVALTEPALSPENCSKNAPTPATTAPAYFAGDRVHAVLGGVLLQRLSHSQEWYSCTATIINDVFIRHKPTNAVKWFSRQGCYQFHFGKTFG